MADPKAAARWRRDAALARGERRVLTAAREALAALVAYTRRALTQSGLDPAVLDNRAPVWRDAITGEVTPAIYSVFAEAWDLIDRGTGIDLTLYGTRYLETVHNRLVGAADDVFDRVRGAIEAGRQEGLHPSVVARDVDALLADTANWEGRARTIARTETIGANNAGARASARATAEFLGYSAEDVMRVWLATGDSRTRESHLEADGMVVYGSESYELAGGSVEGPGDPYGPPEEIISCRCTEQFYFPGDPEYTMTAGGPMEPTWRALTAAVEQDEPLPVIVAALPADGDAVHGIGEEQKHATLCYLGPVEGADLPSVYDAIETWLSLADTAPHTPVGGTVDVQGVETLGDGGARVWMLDDAVLRNLRDGLLGLEPIGDLDGEHNEHPEFTAHVTIDYAEDGADALAPEVEEAAGNVSRITFDRLAVWAGTEQTEYPLTGEAGDTEEAPVGAEDSTTAGGTLLARRTQGGAAEETLTETVDRLVASGFFPDRAHAVRSLSRALNQPLTAAAGDPAPTPAETDDEGMDLAVGDSAPPLVEEPGYSMANPDRFHGICTVEDQQTGDGRVFAAGAIYWDEAALPMPLGWQPADAPGHDGAVICGRIDTFERVGNAITYTGTWDMEGAGWETRRLVAGQFLRGISVDTDDNQVAIVNQDGTPVDGFDMFMPEDPDAEPVMLVQRSRLRASTLCRVPAFAPSGTEGAYIANGLPEDLAAAVEAGVEGPEEPTEDEAVEAITAAAVAARVPAQVTERPPAEWFSRPDLDNPTPITISDTGRVFGHIAAWGTCHIGIEGTCVTPPKSVTDYAHFAHGITDTSGGPVITGLLTMGTGHAAADLRALPAAAHYDDTGTQFATVCVGEDDLGIWVAGSVLASATSEQIDAVRRAGALSGDWRRIRGNLELVAALAVNVPGFPIPRLSVAASAAEGQTALIAAGVVTRDVEAASEAMRDGTLTATDVRAIVAAALTEHDRARERRGRIEKAARTLRASRAIAAAARIGG